MGVIGIEIPAASSDASVRLFRKLKSGQIRPTETGLAFIVLARLVLEVRDEAIDALIAIERGEVNLVRFGSTPSLMRNYSAASARFIKNCFPDVPFVLPMAMRRTSFRK
jgi:DNA-binding transcriptional LysR family regulator